ncbi:MAG: InlB B-repeat-containing protein [Treponema sp.]|nr:InlB B-repeat-containing protein [Treponema sp.]
MSKQKTFPNLIIILLALFIFSCDINLSGSNPDNGSGNNPGNGVPPTPSLALRAVPVAASSSAPKVLDSYTDGSKNYYLIDVGYIRNMYVSDVVAPLHYNGITPMSLSRTTVTSTTIAEAMRDTITNSITQSNTQSGKVGLDVAWKNTLGIGKLESQWSVGLKLEWSGSWTNSNTTTRSTETSITETRSRSESVSISFTIGNNGEPAGYYRYALYSVSDVYFILSTSLDNQELLSWDTVACVRDVSFLPHLDYEANGNFDNSPTTGNDITFTEDFYKTLPKPSAVLANPDDNIPSFTVTFSANGATGSPPVSLNVKKDGIIPVPNQGTLSYSGRAFIGWNTQSNGSGTNYLPGANFVVTNDITLYAVWIIISKEYTIGTMFDSGGLGTEFGGYKTIDDISAAYRADFSITQLKELGYTRVTFTYTYSMYVWGTIEYRLRLRNVTTNTTFREADLQTPGDGKSFDNKVETFSADLSKLEDNHTLEIQANYRKTNFWWGGDFDIKSNRKLKVTFSIN